METGDENSISPMTEASIQGSPTEGVKYPALMGNANRRVLRGIHNLIVGGSAQVIGKRPSQEQFAASPNQKQFSFSYPQIEKKQKRAAITGAENLVDDDSCCTVPMEVILPLLMAPDAEMGEISESNALETEMEDVNEEEEEDVIPNIDIPDLKNPLAVVEYVEEFYDFYRISKKQKTAAITGAENLVDDSCCTVPMEVILPLLMAPDVEMGEISESNALETEMEDINEEEEEEEAEAEDEEEEEEEEEDDVIPNIDIPDLKNPLAVVEYVEEIYDFYRISEDLSCVDPIYMSQQSDITENMRAVLIDWLIEVHCTFELREETLFLTVNLIDRFLALHDVTRKNLQLVGVTALLLACKYEEVAVPVVGDLIIICDRAYTRTDLLQMERLMVNTLQFNMSVPTPYVFMKRFLKAAQCYKKLEFLSFFMVELCLVDYNMLHFRPSLLAAAAVFTAQCTLNGFISWSKCSEQHSQYTQEDLLECSRMMVHMHTEASDGKLTGVYRKFNTPKYWYVSAREPALFLLGEPM